jgi:hypothetical protein
MNYIKYENQKLYFPEVIKKLPGFINGVDERSQIPVKHPTIKHGNAVTDLYRHGAIIPLWVDLLFSPKTAVEGKTGLVATEPWQEPMISHFPRDLVYWFIK